MKLKLQVYGSSGYKLCHKYNGSFISACTGNKNISKYFHFQCKLLDEPLYLKHSSEPHEP